MEYAYGNQQEESAERFEKLFGCSLENMFKLDYANFCKDYPNEVSRHSKYMLYSDYFNGYLDYTVKRGAGKRYEEFAADLAKTARRSRRYGYVFDTAAKLCEVLALKYELGVRTREAYQAGDKETLRGLAENEYARLPKLINAYGRAYEKQWMADNKPHGFDVQDLRLGGLIRRTESCRRRLLDYVNGRIDVIDELEEKILPLGEEGKSTVANRVRLASTVNVT